MKEIKWLGQSLQAYSIKWSMKLYLKMIGCSCYTCLPCTALATTQSARKKAAPSTGTGAPQMDQRLLTNTWPKNKATT